MNEKEAREMIALHDAGDCEECFEGECCDEARGYLAALEGPEMTAERERREKAERLADKLAKTGLAVGDHVADSQLDCAFCQAIELWREYKGEK